jgi:ELWxxDGT repeat protein
MMLLFHYACFADNVTRIGNKTYQVKGPHSFCTFNNWLWFGANNGNSGVHLFFSDGTPDSMNISVSAFPGRLENLTVANGNMYFTSGQKVYYVSMVAGVHVYELNTFLGLPQVQRFHSFREYNGRLLFIVEYASDAELYSIDLMTNTVWRVAALTGKSFSGTYEYAIFNNKLYFPAVDGAGDKELWVSDLTSAGTHVLTDIYPGGDSDPANLTVHNNRLYFSAEDAPVTGTHHYKPWSTDGTDTGTHLLKNVFAPGTYPVKFFDLGSKLLFTVQGMQQDHTLYATDGTAAGTDSLETVEYMTYSFGYKGNLYFSAGSGTNPVLWRTDGTANGTDIFSNATQKPQAFTVYNDKLYFKAMAAPLNGFQLWSTDGTSIQVHQFPKNNQNGPLDQTEEFFEYHSGLYFNAMYDSTGNTLWKLDPFPTSVPQVVTHDGMELYPNPATDRIVVNMPQQAAAPRRMKVELYSLEGRYVGELYSGEYANALQLALPEVSAGVYLINVSADGRSLYRRQLMVQQ